MSLETNTKKPIKSHDDLIEIIDQTGIKHELIDGKIIMMSGGSKRHSEISLNLAIILKSSLKDTDCKVYNSDVKLVVKKEHNHNYYFPDVSVECNESINDKDSVLENPFILAEVLSDSTASYIDMANLSLGNELSLYKHLGIKPTDPMRVLYICFVGSPVGKGGGIDNDTYASFSIYLPENYKYSLEYLLKKHIEFYTEKENSEGAFAPLGKKTGTIPEENLVLFGNSFNAIVASLLFLNSREPIFEETKEYTEAMAAANRKSPSKRRKYVESAMVKVNRTFVGDKSPSTSEGSTENEKRTISSHWRRGHYRTQRFGESNLKTKLIWIKPTIVTGGGAPDIKMKDYIV